MGLKQIVANAAKSALNAVGDLKSLNAYLITYTPGEYNTTTGTRDDITTQYKLQHGATLTSFKRFDGVNVRMTDLKATILQSDLPTLVVPQVGSKMKIDGIEYLIVDFGQDPASATWVMQVRTA